MAKSKSKKSPELVGNWLTRSYVNRAELRRRWQMICLGGNRGPGFQEFKHGIWVYHGL